MKLEVKIKNLPHEDGQLTTEAFVSIANNAFFQGNLDLIKKLEKEKNSFRLKEACFQGGIYIAARLGHLDVVQYILPQFREFKYHEKIDGQQLLYEACFSGNIKLVKYIIGSELEPLSSIKKINPHEFNQKNSPYNPLKGALHGKHLDIFKYLLTHHDLDIHMQDDGNCDALGLACENDQLDFVRFIMTSPDILPHTDERLQNQAFFTAIFKGYNEIVNFFLFDLNFEISPDLKLSLESILSTKSMNELEHLVQKRDLFMKYQDCDTTSAKRHKI